MFDKQEPGGHDVKDPSTHRKRLGYEELWQACLSSCPQVSPQIERNQSRETRTREKSGESMARRYEEGPPGLWQKFDVLDFYYKFRKDNKCLMTNFMVRSVIEQ